MTSIQQLIFEMLTANTGTHFLDSGGANGRMWQRNAKKSLKDFEREPSATLEIEHCKDGQIFCNPTVSVFHRLTQTLDLDSVCEEFNSQPVGDWGDDYYGVSNAGATWIKDRFEDVGNSFNTYNWTANLSQVLQGQELKHLETGDTYLLLQVHGGADVRGGYTDARLFKVPSGDVHNVLSEDCSFPIVDWMGEFINHEGQSATDDDFKSLIRKCRVKKGSRKTIKGEMNERN
jgi:hypothetical protein